MCAGINLLKAVFMYKNVFLPLLFIGIQIGISQTRYDKELANYFDARLQPFYYGVASGDPTNNSVIIWTKAEPANQETSVKIDWLIASDSALQKVVQKGTINASAVDNYTASADVKNLRPGTHYYYQFSSGGKKSVIGRTKTAPQQTDSLKFAVVSCSNYEAGFFNAYRAISARNDLDAVIHLGDYIYEYGAGAYGDSVLKRKHIPSKEIIDLDDYRARYAQYRLDKDLQELHRLHPFIVVWDDHEVANNSYKDGAQNHQPATEGSWKKREAEAVKAYFEWLPIRHFDNTIYRKFQYGNLAELFMIDGRLAGRDKQADSVTQNYQQEDRTLLGKEQFNWLVKGLTTSKAKWKIIGNDVMMSYINYANLLPKESPIFLDMWDGYPSERRRLFTEIKKADTKNIVVITGDIHCSWGMEITASPKDSNASTTASTGPIGAEFITPSITSRSFGEVINNAQRTVIAESLLTKTNQHLKFVNLTNHGYLILTLNNRKAQSDWFFVQTIAQPQQPAEKMGKSLYINDNSYQVQSN
jgi:alkaline phosphatase D